MDLRLVVDIDHGRAPQDLHRAAHKFGILSTSALASHLSSSLPPSNVTAVSWFVNRVPTCTSVAVKVLNLVRDAARSGRKLTDQLLILSQTDVAIGLPGQTPASIYARSQLQVWGCLSAHSISKPMRALTFGHGAIRRVRFPAGEPSDVVIRAPRL
eukprot:2633337-Rhodomonas_salina.4